MSQFRYPFDALSGDYVRAGAGTLVCGAPLPFLSDNLVAMSVLGGLTVLFVYFGWRTYVRQRTEIEVDQESIRASGIIQRRLMWGSLEQVKLSYFSTRRDRRDGWMQLSLRAQEGRLRIDSNIQGFDTLARHAYDAAVAKDLELSHATLGNFQALGIYDSESSTGWGDPSSWTEEARSG